MKIKNLYNFAKNELFSLNRSITGKDTLKTLLLIQKKIPNLKIKKIKSGTKVFDWKIPPEWNVKNAYVKDKLGTKIIDFKNNNLHLIGYSKKLKTKIKRDNLLKKIYFLKKQPKAIPYITSYYKKNWGFCTTYQHYIKIKKNYKKNDYFDVLIDANHNNKGHLNFGELIIKGKSKKEILISSYICHPSMANNELSGVIVSCGLMNFFQKKKPNKTLRFILIPETIGSIAYLSKNLNKLKKNVVGGYNLSCIGDNRAHSCMFTKNLNSPSDEAIIEAYKSLKIKKYKIYSFLKRGSDERQYNSPGIDLPISSIFRSKYGTYPEYHTSLDNFNLVNLKGIKGGFSVAKKSIEILLDKIIPKNKILCEPMMSKRSLYPNLSLKGIKSKIRSNMDFLQYADGNSSLERISKKIKVDFQETKKIYYKLKKNKLVD